MNKNLFNTLRNRGQTSPPANTLNNENAPAYSMSDAEALLQLAVTACFGDTFYVSAEDQLENVLAVCERLDTKFIAQTAIYARKNGYMKDMPALLVAYLAKRDPIMFSCVFPTVCDNALMVKRVANIIRSGVVGRKSFGTAIRREFRLWLDSLTDEQVFKASVGGDVSMADLIKMVHPRPKTNSRDAVYAYLVGKGARAQDLPALVKQFERFKKGEFGEGVPDVPFEMLTGLQLTYAGWEAVAQTMSWTATRMNLNTMQRHGVFKDAENTRMVAERLRDPSLVQKSRVFPYQLLTAYLATRNSGLPHAISDALQDAMEIAVSNVPRISGQVVVCVDVSGSMSAPVTGKREGATSVTNCKQAAALIAAVFMRMNSSTRVLPFTTEVYACPLNSRDSVMTNAELLSRLPSGGTACAAPMQLMNQEKYKADLIVYASDNESWFDSGGQFRLSGPGRAAMAPPLAPAWSEFKARNPNAKMVCIDLAPDQTRQADRRVDTLNIGGFSDTVFDVINDFVNGKINRDLVATVSSISIPSPRMINETPATKKAVKKVKAGMKKALKSKLGRCHNTEKVSKSSKKNVRRALKTLTKKPTKKTRK